MLPKSPIGVSANFIKRLPKYYNILVSLKEKGKTSITSTELSELLGLNAEKIKKDLQIVSSETGKPKNGRDISILIKDIETYLGYNNISDAVIIGVGSLGSAFLKYDGFSKLGLNILAGFDVDPNKIDTQINGKIIFSIDKLETLIPRLNVHIAILTVPNQYAAELVPILVKAGIKGIWNFTHEHLSVPEDVVVENIDLASSLAILSHKLKIQ